MATETSRDTANEKARMSMEPEVVKEWLTPKEAGHLVSLSRATLWRLCSAGTIEHRKVGRAVRINRKSLEAYMRRDGGSAVTRKPEASNEGRP
jgi:excisionase family DNA binding protein